jgi:Flp pilus assembly protein TadG
MGLGSICSHLSIASLTSVHGQPFCGTAVAVSPGPRGRPAARRGFTFIYTIVSAVALLGVASLAVDFGRVQLAKAELCTAVDSAARAAAANMSLGATSARSAAVQVAAQNRVDGSTLSLGASDVVFGIWDNGVFSALPDASIASANAVRILGARAAAKGNAIPLLIASTIGFSHFDIRAQSVAVNTRMTSRVDGGISGTVDVPSSSNVWLAGKPSTPGGAYGSLPPRFGLTVRAGDVLNISTVGSWRDFSTAPLVNADGDAAETKTYSLDRFGKSNITTFETSLVAVFLDDSDPTSSAAPVDLSHVSASDRDYHTIAPKLKQVFYVGDGNRLDGSDQRIIVPPGTTRFYLGCMEGSRFDTNSGQIQATVMIAPQIRTVK